MRKVWRGSVSFNKSSWCIIYCSPGRKMKNKNLKNIPSFITCAFAVAHTITFSLLAQPKFRLFPCKLLWQMPTVGDECFYKTTIMSLHINDGSTSLSSSMFLSIFFCFLFKLVCFIEWQSLPGKARISILMLLLFSFFLSWQSVFHSVWPVCYQYHCCLYNLSSYVQPRSAKVICDTGWSGFVTL